MHRAEPKTRTTRTHGSCLKTGLIRQAGTSELFCRPLSSSSKLAEPWRPCTILCIAR